MYQSLDLFRTSSAMARHAAARQAIVTVNVANSDTPGYRAQTLGSFADSYAAGPTQGLRASRPGHIGGVPTQRPVRPGDAGVEASPNGNTVSIEAEMFRAVEAQREHSRAMAIYRHAMGVLRTTLGR